MSVENQGCWLKLNKAGSNFLLIKIGVFHKTFAVSSLIGSSFPTTNKSKFFISWELTILSFPPHRNKRLLFEKYGFSNGGKNVFSLSELLIKCTTFGLIWFLKKNSHNPLI